MRFATVLLALATCALGCANSATVPDDDATTCAPECASWQSCDDGKCEVAAGHCAVTTDCDASGLTCDAQTHVCVDDPHCSACEAWEQCLSGACEPAAGRCGGDGDCTTGVCNPATHRCTEVACAPACAEWESCTGRTCGLAAGRCLADLDCSAAQPSCETAAHRCREPAFSQPSTEIAHALIVTSDGLRDAFADLARLHTLTGVTTRVVTLSEICRGRTCNADPRTDTAKAIKDYLQAQHQLGLELVVLGGDIEQVPSRKVHDHFANAAAGADFTQDFFTDYYFADLSAWDANGDGVYAADGVDSPDYRPELGVTRIPASSVDEVEVYAAKVLSHLTAYDLARVRTALLLSNVATEFTVAGVDVPIDGSIYFEMDGRTESLVSPFTVKKLYAVPPPQVEQITLPREIQELQRSHNIVVHNGHGRIRGLTSEMNGDRELTGDMAYALENTQFPFILSCACDAGTFSANDSAGEDVVNAPDGGAIGYLGNSATGLGLAGGSQFVDEFLRHVFTHPNALVGDAIRAAHENEPSTDSIPIPLPWIGSVNVQVVDQDAYEWTQKSVVFLGDGLIPVWTEATLSLAPDVTVTKAALGQFTRLDFTLSRVVAGTLRVAIGADLFEVPIANGAGSLVLRTAPAHLSWGFSSPTTLAAQGDVTL